MRELGMLFRGICTAMLILLLPLNAMASKTVTLEWSSASGMVSVETGQTYPAVNMYHVKLTNIHHDGYIYEGQDNKCQIIVPDETTKVCFCVTVNDNQFASIYECVNISDTSGTNNPFIQVQIIP